MTLVIVAVVSASGGFVAGALVYRNNAKALEKKADDLQAAVNALKGKE